MYAHTTWEHHFSNSDVVTDDGIGGFVAEGVAGDSTCSIAQQAKAELASQFVDTPELWLRYIVQLLDAEFYRANPFAATDSRAVSFAKTVAQSGRQCIDSWCTTKNNNPPQNGSDGPSDLGPCKCRQNLRFSSLLQTT